jgi:hypothetical protein
MGPAVRVAANSRPVVLALATTVLVAALALAALAPAQSPVTGGTVPSTLSLSLGEPSGFRRTGSSPDGNVYTAIVRAEVTATDTPARLSVVGGGVASVARPLRSWTEPVSHGMARVRLRAIAPSARALRASNRLFLVTLTAGGP